jgi:hypothetical protein
MTGAGVRGGAPGRMIGILGGSTTFSSFSLQTLTLPRGGDVGAAILNVTLSVVAGPLAACAGEQVASAIWLSRRSPFPDGGGRYEAGGRGNAAKGLHR